MRLLKESDEWWAEVQQNNYSELAYFCSAKDVIKNFQDGAFRRVMATIGRLLLWPWNSAVHHAYGMLYILSRGITGY